MRFGGTIIKPSGPFVAGHFQTTIIAFEIAVMKSPRRMPHLAPNRNSFITGMRGGSRQGVVLQMINDQIIGNLFGIHPFPLSSVNLAIITGAVYWYPSTSPFPDPHRDICKPPP